MTARKILFLDAPFLSKEGLDILQQGRFFSLSDGNEKEEQRALLAPVWVVIGGYGYVVFFIANAYECEGKRHSQEK